MNDCRPERRAVIRAAIAGLAWVAAEAASGERWLRIPLPATAASAARATPEPETGFNAAGENRQPGTPWRDVESNWSATPTLEGFLGQHASTARRRIVDVYVNSSLRSIRIKAYRIGHYAGEGQRLVWTSAPVPVWRQQPFTLDRATGMVFCDWRVTTSINTTGWPEP